MGTKRNDIKYDKAYDLYQAGMSLQQVAEYFAITRQTLFTAFKRRGFTLRGKNIIINDNILNIIKDERD